MKNLPMDEAALNIDNEQVDLHVLHAKDLKLCAADHGKFAVPNPWLHTQFNVVDGTEPLAHYWVETRILHQSQFRWPVVS